MLITLISGVLFYKNLTQIKSPSSGLLKIDFDEVRTLDLQVYSTTLLLRQNLGADVNELKDENTRIKELLDILNDINKNTPELKDSISKIRNHFLLKQKHIEAFQVAVKDLRTNINALMPAYNELERKNIKFVLDKRDFYRECILDSYMFVSFSHKDNETRLTDDQKVLGQIVSYATTPNPELQKFSGYLDTIHKRVKELDTYTKEFKEVTIAPEMKVIAKYYQESLQAQSDQNENLLTFMFAAIGIYLLFMIFILRKS
ncbi:MAG: hypothetical protein H7177_05220 [Rhizobacter sp.]|nr:hypothetical protein [Bacteriovorax sp.]